MASEQYGSNRAGTSEKLAEMPAKQYAQSAGIAGSAGRQSTKDMLLSKAESMRREAHELEALAYAVEHVRGDAEMMLYRLLSAHVYR